MFIETYKIIEVHEEVSLIRGEDQWVKIDLIPHSKRGLRQRV